MKNIHAGINLLIASFFLFFLRNNRGTVLDFYVGRDNIIVSLITCLEHKKCIKS